MSRFDIALLQEQINDHRLMIDALAKNVKALNMTEEMKWKSAWARLVAETNYAQQRKIT